MDCRELYKPTEVCHLPSVCMLHLIRPYETGTIPRNELSANYERIPENGKIFDFEFLKSGPVIKK